MYSSIPNISSMSDGQVFKIISIVNPELFSDSANPFDILTCCNRSSFLVLLH